VEEERYEMDRVIQTNAYAIETFDQISKQLQFMSQEEVQKFQLSNDLGSTSEVICQQAIKRIYGDKAHEVIEGLKRNPSVVIPIILSRLRQKEEEWKRAQVLSLFELVSRPI